MWLDRKSTRLNSSHSGESRMPSSAWKNNQRPCAPHVASSVLHRKLRSILHMGRPGRWFLSSSAEGARSIIRSKSCGSSEVGEKGRIVTFRSPQQNFTIRRWSSRTDSLGLGILHMTTHLNHLKHYYLPSCVSTGSNLYLHFICNYQLYQ